MISSVLIQDYLEQQIWINFSETFQQRLNTRDAEMQSIRNKTKTNNGEENEQRYSSLKTSMLQARNRSSDYHMMSEPQRIFGKNSP